MRRLFDEPLVGYGAATADYNSINIYMYKGFEVICNVEAFNEVLSCYHVHLWRIIQHYVVSISYYRQI